MPEAPVIGVSYRGTGTPHPIDVAVGQAIREQRILRGMSQTKLADSVGLTFQQVQKYERAANRVSASKLYEIAQALNVPIQRLYGHIDAPDEPVHGHERLALEHTRNFRLLPEAERDAVHRFVKRLAESRGTESAS
jgi:transcriptional regulator with XRE-family HTH domain